MKIFSNNVDNGYLADPFGCRGTQILSGKKPTRSFHLGWQDLPVGTKSLALIFIDHDAIPVYGFSWIHWTVANIDPTWSELPENASREMDLLEGVTSWSSGMLPAEWHLEKEEATGYGGCAPPDQTHDYTLTLYALDTQLILSRGFFMNELFKAMQGHILEQASLSILYRPK